MPTVSVNGRNIGYEESGSGDPLILIHGGQSDRTQFDLIRPLLGEGIRAIAYDQRDTRDNVFENAPPYGFHDHAQDCVDFMTAMGIEKAHVMGTSYGGMIAMTTAIDFPERVHSLILSSTTASFAMAEPLATQATSSERSADEIQQFSMQHMVTAGTVDREAKMAETKAAVRPGPPEAVARRMAAARDHDVRDDLHRIKAITMVLIGDEDPFISTKTAAWTAEQIKGATVTVVPGGGHSLTRHHRDQTAPIVREFVLSHRIG